MRGQTWGRSSLIKAEELNRFEAAKALRKIGLPKIARRVVVKNVRGKFIMYPVDEDIFIIDKKRGVVYTNEDSVYDRVCYPVENGGVVCFPKKPVITDPSKVSEKPLERDEFEEGLIDIEDMLDDDTMYGHFAYYCRTRGGHPVVVDTDKGTGMVCVGGKIDGYGIVSESVVDDAVVLSKDMPDGGRALTLFYLGKKYSDAMAKTHLIIPAEQYRKYGLRVHFVE